MISVSSFSFSTCFRDTTRALCLAFRRPAVFLLRALYTTQCIGERLLQSRLSVANSVRAWPVRSKFPCRRSHRDGPQCPRLVHYRRGSGCFPQYGVGNIV